MDLLLDQGTGDLVWHNGPLQVEDTTQPFTQTVAQRLFIRLRTNLSEWFINTAYGIPYLQLRGVPSTTQTILGKKASKESVDLIFQQNILAENGVKEITSFNSTFTNRQYSMTFTVKVTSGDITQPITITI